jgi:hypothetical protein
MELEGLCMFCTLNESLSKCTYRELEANGRYCHVSGWQSCVHNTSPSAFVRRFVVGDSDTSLRAGKTAVRLRLRVFLACEELRMSRLQHGGMDASGLRLAIFASLTLMSCSIDTVRRILAATAIGKWLLPAEAGKFFLTQVRIRDVKIVTSTSVYMRPASR